MGGTASARDVRDALPKDSPTRTLEIGACKSLAQLGTFELCPLSKVSYRVQRDDD
jgi:hypothetical protein